MNDQPNMPEEIDYSVKAGGHWMLLLFLADVPGAFLIHHYKDWPMMARVLLSLLPLPVAVFYVRAIVRWIRGMDEMYRQITVSSFAFAMVVYLAMSGVWTLLVDKSGIMENIFPHWSRLGPADRTPFTDLFFMVAMIYILFKVVYVHIFSRRYK
jgi:hypothetical protein